MAPKTRILSIDGGGIRGIIPGQILVNLEEKLKKKSKNKHARIADYFDIIAGTSTGGILTFAYLTPDDKKPGRPRFTAEEVVDLYLKRGKNIFDVPFGKKFSSLFGLADEIYPAKGLEKTLTNYFGELRLSQLLKPSLVTAYNINERKAMFFNPHKVHEGKQDDFLVRDIARATSAAPTYFESANIQSIGGRHYPLIDGGVFANNPALCAYSEARKIFERPDGSGNVTAKDMQVLSLGTGTNEKRYDHKDVKKWGSAQWAKPVISMMMSGVSETVDHHLQWIFDSIDAPDQYLRINPELKPDMDAAMDNASRQNMKKLKKLGQEAFEHHEQELERIADELIEAEKVEQTA